MAGKKAAARTVYLSGEQTVRTIFETHAAVVSAFSGTNAVALDTSKVEDADLTFVQLIESARVTAASLGKTFCMSKPLPAALIEQLERAGFLNSPASFWKTATP